MLVHGVDCELVCALGASLFARIARQTMVAWAVVPYAGITDDKDAVILQVLFELARILLDSRMVCEVQVRQGEVASSTLWIPLQEGFLDTVENRISLIVLRPEGWPHLFEIKPETADTNELLLRNGRPKVRPRFRPFSEPHIWARSARLVLIRGPICHMRDWRWWWHLDRDLVPIRWMSDDIALSLSWIWSRNDHLVSQIFCHLDFFRPR